MTASAVTLLCLGVNHRTAPLSVREQLAFSRTEVPEAVRALRGLPGVHEAVLLSTCNRVECYLAGQDDSRLRAGVATFFRKRRKVSRATLVKALYEYTGLDAVQHLIEVAAGLDSQVVGESQVLAQVREAHEVALRSSATSTLLNGMFNRALAAAKRVRHETEIGRLPASVSSVAVNLAEKIFGSLANRSVLLLGTGETSVLVAENLIEGGSPKLLVAGERHVERAQALAAKYRGEAVQLSEALVRLAEVDIVIVATAAAEHVVRREHVAEALHQRRSRPMFLIDLSVPRNVDPAVANLSNVYLYNIDDLKLVADENLKRREQWITPARAIVAEAVQGTQAWLESLQVVPTIKLLQRYGETCRQEVWARAGRAVTALPPETRAEMEYLTQALVAKLLHRPVSELKNLAGRNGAASYTDMLRQLFKLR